ncbi:MAG TPA: JAB domain-containing protein [Drouetiella sp.]
MAKLKLKKSELHEHLKYIVPEIRLVLIKEPAAEEPAFIRCPEDIEKFVQPMKFYPEEHFVSFHLNARHAVTGHQIVSRGTLSASLVHPREVFKAAILGNSHSIIVAHNHPGGSTEPSTDDLDTTEQLIKGGKLLGISVLDHIIVSSKGLNSLRETHPELWTRFA